MNKSSFVKEELPENAMKLGIAPFFYRGFDAQDENVIDPKTGNYIYMVAERPRFYLKGSKDKQCFDDLTRFFRKLISNTHFILDLKPKYSQGVVFDSDEIRIVKVPFPEETIETLLILLNDFLLNNKIFLESHEKIKASLSKFQSDHYIENNDFIKMLHEANIPIEEIQIFEKTLKERQNLSEAVGTTIRKRKYSQVLDRNHDERNDLYNVYDNRNDWITNEDTKIFNQAYDKLGEEVKEQFYLAVKHDLCSLWGVELNSKTYKYVLLPNNFFRMNQIDRWGNGDITLADGRAFTDVMVTDFVENNSELSKMQNAKAENNYLRVIAMLWQELPTDMQNLSVKELYPLARKAGLKDRGLKEIIEKALQFSQIKR